MSSSVGYKQSDVMPQLRDSRITFEDIATFPRPGCAAPDSIAFSPDDSVVTYLASADGSLTRQLYAMDIATGAVRPARIARVRTDPLHIAALPRRAAPSHAALPRRAAPRLLSRLPPAAAAAAGQRAEALPAAYGFRWRSFEPWDDLCASSHAVRLLPAPPSEPPSAARCGSCASRRRARARRRISPSRRSSAGA
jgi:hypothetical protein